MFGLIGWNSGWNPTKVQNLLFVYEADVFDRSWEEKVPPVLVCVISHRAVFTLTEMFSSHVK